MEAPNPSLHIAMFFWFAMGHYIPSLILSNKLAKQGHRVSFIIPTKTQQKLQHLNLHPDLITFIPIVLPHVQGLPPGSETTNDVPFELGTLLATAMDETKDQVEALLRDLKVDVVFFDFAHWIPSLARQLGIKSFNYCAATPAAIGFNLSRERHRSGSNVSEAELKQPPASYPASNVTLRAYEARNISARREMKYGSNILFFDRLFIGVSQCDALGFRACREIDGPYCNYLENQTKKPVFLAGPLIPEPSMSPNLEEKWEKWLGKFDSGSVIYCAFGSECIMKKDEFQELVNGLVLTGMPFLAALKPPIGVDSIEEALPDKFEESVQGRGVVHGGWIQQQLILKHPSIGCFITHCGTSSLVEALLNKCQLVLLPNVYGDQIINARIFSRNLKVGVEVEKDEEDGALTRENVYKAVAAVMEENSDVAKQVRNNHAKLRNLLLDKDLDSFYIHNFINKLQELVKG
ncbi:cyanidin 3-O-galactoside 2''-O-xylosyltransferase FGGT1-like [Apium graveolens]|uniref:cyanidin 3-O-galactoside 2''-O-xylosyltransferase FGGT1-like n=1 Tax=Apium graveolens TaxID=4045 RepID=UPI003D78E892